MPEGFCVLFDTDNMAIMAFDSKGNEIETPAEEDEINSDTLTAVSEPASTPTSDAANGMPVEAIIGICAGVVAVIVVDIIVVRKKKG